MRESSLKTSDYWQLDNTLVYIEITDCTFKEIKRVLCINWCFKAKLGPFMLSSQSDKSWLSLWSEVCPPSRVGHRVDVRPRRPKQTRWPSVTCDFSGGHILVLARKIRFGSVRLNRVKPWLCVCSFSPNPLLNAVLCSAWCAVQLCMSNVRLETMQSAECSKVQGCDWNAGIGCLLVEQKPTTSFWHCYLLFVTLVGSQEDCSQSGWTRKNHQTNKQFKGEG